jgi:hypothetical protein
MAVSDHPVDIVKESACKLALLADLFGHTINENDTPNICPRAVHGLAVIFSEIEHDLLAAYPRLCLNNAQEV